MSDTKYTYEIEKMKRKIAQLTRVVYILNTKNMENESVIESIKSGYDIKIKEMTQLIHKLQKKVKKLKTKNEKINEKYENNINEFRQEYENYKENLKQQIKTLNDEYTNKYNLMLKELKQLRIHCDGNDIKQSNEELNNERIRKDMNEKLKQMKKEYDEKITEYKKKNKSPSEIFGNVKDVNNDLTEQNERLKETFLELKKEIVQYKEKLSLYEKNEVEIQRKLIA